MTLGDILGKGGKLLTDNSTTLLTAGGVVGVFATALLTGRASFQASQAIETEKADRFTALATSSLDPTKDEVKSELALSTGDKVKLAWPYFVPAVAVGVATVTSIVMANRVSAKQAAALAAAYGLTQNQLEEYKAKVLEKVGVNKTTAIQDAIAQDSVTKDPPSGQVLLLGEGLVLCKDSLSGRYFQSSADRIRKAENAINAQLFHHQICSLNFFYEEIDLPITDLGDGLGWSMMTSDHKQVEIKISAVLTDEERPCLVISFNQMPVHNYEQLY